MRAGHCEGHKVLVQLAGRAEATAFPGNDFKLLREGFEGLQKLLFDLWKRNVGIGVRYPGKQRIKNKVLESLKMEKKEIARSHFFLIFESKMLVLDEVEGSWSERRTKG